MKDFMIEGKRYVFKDKFKASDFFGLPIELVKAPIMLAVYIISVTLVEPKMSFEEIGELNFLELSKLTKIINELYLGQYIIDEDDN